MSSFAISGRIVFDGSDQCTALVRVQSTERSVEAFSETRRLRVHASEDARMRLLELVAALAREIRGRGDHVSEVEIQ